jgi:hypothetical protein
LVSSSQSDQKSSHTFLYSKHNIHQIWFCLDLPCIDPLLLFMRISSCPCLIHFHFFRKAAKGFCRIFIRRIKKKKQQIQNYNQAHTRHRETPQRNNANVPKRGGKQEKLTLLLLLICLYICPCRRLVLLHLILA